MSAFKDIVEGSQAYSESFSHGSLSALPQARLVIVTCMDTRINPLAIFGLDIGEAHVLRNAGARVTPDVIRSLIKSINQLEVERVVVMHHTDCGAAKIKIDSLRTAVQSATGNDPDDVEFHLIGDPDEALRADVEAIRTCPYFPVGTAVAGMVYDVHTGIVTTKHETFVS
jgi:carbonic anhydrase